MKNFMNARDIILNDPGLLEAMASSALAIYNKLAPGPDESKEAHKLLDKKRLLCAAAALTYVLHDASVRASHLKDALQELQAYKSPDCTDREIPTDYSSLCALFLNLQRAAPVLLVPNKDTIHEEEKSTNPSKMFGNIPLSFSDNDKDHVGAILRRIERHFFSIGVFETIFRLLDGKYLPIARSVFGRDTLSALPLNMGAHPRDFGEKRFADTYKKTLGPFIENERKAARPMPAYCVEDQAMIAHFEQYQNDILTQAIDPSRSIINVSSNGLFKPQLIIIFSSLKRLSWLQPLRRKATVRRCPPRRRLRSRRSPLCRRLRSRKCLQRRRSYHRKCPLRHRSHNRLPNGRRR